jgi:MinD-like ATPase involved in chromosome partitioning or flagellar assembly
MVCCRYENFRKSGSTANPGRSRGLRFFCFSGGAGGKDLARTIVLAVSEREYAARLAEYLRLSEPGWEISAFTHESALRLRAQEPRGIDILIGRPELLRLAEPLAERAARTAALVEEAGEGEGRWTEIAWYQPLPGVAAAIRSMMADRQSKPPSGCRVWTVFSASGGAGKTTVALNLVRQAGERGLRTLYLNLEMLNATSRLFGNGEPDSLSRLLYVLQTEPAEFSAQWERIVRHQPYLRTDFVDAPDHPGERASMSPDLLADLVTRIRESGRYDLIVADPDSGVGDWHRRLLSISDRIAWLVTDDWQTMEKAASLLGYWREEGTEWLRRLSFVRNRAQGLPMNRWNLPEPPAGILPYIPQWKAMDEPGRMFGSAAFCGVLDGLLDEWGLERAMKGGRPDGRFGPAGG